MSNGIMYIARPADAPPPRRMSSGQVMEWSLLLFMMFWPRLFILGFWLFSNELRDAFSSWVIPAAGFLVAPATTLAYTFMWGISSNTVSGWEWIVVAIGVLLDVGTWLGTLRLVRR